MSARNSIRLVKFWSTDELAPHDLYFEREALKSGPDNEFPEAPMISQVLASLMSQSTFEFTKDLGKFQNNANLFLILLRHYFIDETFLYL